MSNSLTVAAWTIIPRSGDEYIILGSAAVALKDNLGVLISSTNPLPVIDPRYNIGDSGFVANTNLLAIGKQSLVVAATTWDSLEEPQGNNAGVGTNYQVPTGRTFTVAKIIVTSSVAGAVMFFGISTAGANAAGVEPAGMEFKMSILLQTANVTTVFDKLSIVIQAGEFITVQYNTIATFYMTALGEERVT